jgi:hypothetical protein
MDVQIKGRTVTLAAPASHAARTKALLALAQDGWIGMGAALGVCWQGRPALKATLAGCRWDGMAYGAAVRDELHAAGVSESEVAEAASKAITLLVDSYPREEAVQSHADFIEAPKGDSTP